MIVLPLQALWTLWSKATSLALVRSRVYSCVRSTLEKVTQLLQWIQHEEAFTNPHMFVRSSSKIIMRVNSLFFMLLWLVKNYLQKYFKNICWKRDVKISVISNLRRNVKIFYDCLWISISIILLNSWLRYTAHSDWHFLNFLNIKVFIISMAASYHCQGWVRPSSF